MPDGTWHPAKLETNLDGASGRGTIGAQSITRRNQAPKFCFSKQASSVGQRDGLTAVLDFVRERDDRG